MAKNTVTKSFPDNRNHRVWTVVTTIPRGCVATYGQIACLADVPGPSGARQVGYALSDLTGRSPVPWHRVVNAKGQISARGDGTSAARQRALLEAEGVEFGLRDIIELERYQWRP